MIKFYSILFLAFLFIHPAKAQFIEPPKAEKQPHVTIIHGDTLTDNYFWLRDKFTVEVENYLYLENGYADKMMENTTTLQKVLYEEMKNLRKETNQSQPFKRGQYFYYSKNEKGSEYGKLCRKKDSLTNKEEVYLDLNKLAEQFQYFRLSENSLSDNQNLLLYGIDTKGNNLSHLYLKNISQDTTYDLKIDSVLSVVWYNDNKNILFIKAEPKTLRSYRIYRFNVEDISSGPTLIKETRDKNFSLGIGVSTSKEYIFLSEYGQRASEFNYQKRAEPDSPFTLFCPIRKEIRYFLNHFNGNEFYVSTNDTKTNNRLVKLPIIPVNDFSQAITVIPSRKNIAFSNYLLTNNFFIYSETEKMESRILVKDLKTNKTDTLKTNVKYGSCTFSLMHEEYNYNTLHSILISESNMVTPEQETEYNLQSHQYKVVYKDTLAIEYDPENYITERFWAKSKDSTLIPYTLCYKKGLNLYGKNPVYLSAYGSYGSSIIPSFGFAPLSLLNRGVVVVRASIRGGGEMGDYWHEEGRMLKKKNTFYDFIACTEDLITRNIADPKKIAIQGGSAGGLLMGAVTNMRPDLYSCVVADVPFVDVINTMLDESLPLTIGEFFEWGNPKVKTYYEYIKSYSPYDNIDKKAYPALLLTGGYNDAQVSYWEPAKFCAKLRELKTDSNDLFLKINMSAGHGGGSGRYNAYKEKAFEMAFIFKHLGIKQDYISINGTVQDKDGNVLPFATVAIEGTTKGTLTNLNGEFELDINLNDNPTLVFSTIGFKSEKIKLGIKSQVKDIKIILQGTHLQLHTVTVKSNSKDPSWEIMQKAIEKRKENYKATNTYVADVYIRNTARLLTIPKKIPAFLKTNMVDTAKGIMYLSESIARYAKQNEERKEEMFASKVAGLSKGFSWNRVNDILLNFYEPNINLNNFSERPFVSPLNPAAMGLYKFKFKGNIVADGVLVNVIEVKPRINGDPLFRGEIYISDDNYQIYSLDLYLTKDAGIEFTDTLHIREEFTKGENQKYLLSKVEFKANMGAFGFKVTDDLVASITNYNTNPAFTKKYFGYEVFKIAKNANKKDSTFWSTTRPIVLTAEEDVYYVKQDSVEKKKGSKPYLDSLKKSNHYKVYTFLYSDYRRYNPDEKYYAYANSLLKGIAFNTVEGINYSKEFMYNRWGDSTNNINLSGQVKYGFANKTFYASAGISKKLTGSKGIRLTLLGGRKSENYNTLSTIVPLINSIYTLGYEENYYKLFLNDFGAINLSGDIIPGLGYSSTLNLSRRSPMVNHTTYSPYDWANKTYTSNNPTNPFTDLPAFNQHYLGTISYFVRYTPKLRYETIGEYKRYLPTKNPEFYGGIKAGLTNVNSYYIKATAGVGKDFDWGIAGQLKIDALVGGFAGKNIMFLDYKHFNGNQTLVLYNTQNETEKIRGTRDQLSGFHTLPFYTLSTKAPYLELHAQHNFRGFFIGKIPLLRKTKVFEIAGSNVLLTGNKSFYEVYFGVDNIIKAFRIDFASNVTNGRLNAFNIRFGFRPGVFF